MIKYRMITENGYIETLDLKEAEAFGIYETIEFTEDEHTTT